MLYRSEDNLSRLIAWRRKKYLRSGEGMVAQSGFHTETLWTQLNTDLRRFIARRVRNQADVEDIVQEVLFKIHCHMDRLSQEGSIHAWVYRVTRNAIIDHHRKRRSDVSLDSSPDLPEDFADRSASSDVRDEVSSFLRPIIGCLPEKYGEALLLADLEGLTQSELAARTGLSLSGAKSRVQRARDQLRDMLMQCFELEFDALGRVIDYRLRREDCQCLTEPPDPKKRCS